MTTILFKAMFAINSAPVMPYESGVRQIITVIFLVTFVIPAISISFLRVTKSISSLKLENRKERLIPFFFITIFYGVASWMFLSKLNFTGSINIILITITALILLLTLITLFWKISAHATGVGGVLGFLSAIYLQDPNKESLVSISAAVIMSGLVLSSRLYLNAHNPRQVYAGLFLGFIFSFASILLFA
jgi:membrane-associated phospholipid phosphatase